MSKHDAAPTYGWVFLSNHHRRMSMAFTILLIVLAAFAFIIYGKLDADCTKPAVYEMGLGKYQLTFVANTKADECEKF